MISLFKRWENYSPQVLSIIRIVAALCFLEHGLEKFFGFPAAGPANMTALLYVQGFWKPSAGFFCFLVSTHGRWPSCSPEIWRSLTSWRIFRDPSTPR